MIAIDLATTIQRLYPSNQSVAIRVPVRVRTPLTPIIDPLDQEVLDFSPQEDFDRSKNPSLTVDRPWLLLVLESRKLFITPSRKPFSLIIQSKAGDTPPKIAVLSKTKRSPPSFLRERVDRSIHSGRHGFIQQNDIQH